MSDERVVPGKTHVFNVMKHLVRYTLALQYADGKRVVDAACGSGYGTHLLGQVAQEVVGWDIDQKTIDYAREQYGRKNTAFYVANLEHLPSLSLIGGQKTYDTLVCFETLEHLQDPQGFLRRMKSHVKGHIVASVPLNEPDGFNEHHVHRYNLQSAQTLFTDFRKTGECIQHDITFFEITSPVKDQLFSYYIFVGQTT